MNQPRVAIFASGQGSNAQAIHAFSLKIKDSFDVVAIVTNIRKAGVLDYAKTHEINSIVISKKKLDEGTEIMSFLKSHQVDFIILAGFLQLIPEYLIKEYPSRIINIHPSILPRYGGKGMYGRHVHEAVANAGDTSSGITIHLVNAHYDEGSIIFQTKRTFLPNSSPTKIAADVLELEHHFYPIVINGVTKSFH